MSKGGSKGANRNAYKLKNEKRCRLCERPWIPIDYEWGDEVGSGARELMEHELTPERRKLTRHHLVPARHNGSFANANIVPLCRPCHDKIDHGIFSEQIPYRRALRQKLTEGEMSFIRQRMGEVWLNRNYPPRVISESDPDTPTARVTVLAKRKRGTVRAVHKSQCTPRFCTWNCPVAHPALYGMTVTTTEEEVAS